MLTFGWSIAPGRILNGRDHEPLQVIFVDVAVHLVVLCPRVQDEPTRQVLPEVVHVVNQVAVGIGDQRVLVQTCVGLWSMVSEVSENRR